MAKNNFAEVLAKRTGKTASDPAAVDKAYDEMFGAVLREDPHAKVVDVDIEKIISYANDPFKPYSAEKLTALAESIALNGLLQPVIIRHVEDSENYQMLAGHHRLAAYKLNGHKTIPSIIYDVDDDMAVMIVTETNLKQREKLYPSEKAFAYKLQMDAIKRQGERTDLKSNLTSAQNEQRLSRDIVAEKNNVDKNEIQRYLRLTFLSQELLEMIDEEFLPLMSGVNLSYVDEETQSAINKYLDSAGQKTKISIKKAKAIRDVYEKSETSLLIEQIKEILEGSENPNTQKAFKISRTKFQQFSKFVPDDTELEKLFLEFLSEKFRLQES